MGRVATARSAEDLCLETQVSVGDHEVHALKTAVLQAGEEAGPEHGILGVADADTEDLTDLLSGHARGDHDRTRDDLMVHPCLDVGHVEEHVGVRHMPQRTLPHRCDLMVDVGTDPLHRRA